MKRRADRRVTFNGNDEKGFTLVEVVIAILILTVGLLSLVAAVSAAINYTVTSRYTTETKMRVAESLEQIESLRNTDKLAFQQIANAGQVNNTGLSFDFNGFSTDFQPITVGNGADGIAGTPDDLLNNPQFEPRLMRRITITNLNTFLKKVQVDVRFQTPTGGLVNLTGISFLNDDRRRSRSN